MILFGAAAIYFQFKLIPFLFSLALGLITGWFLGTKLKRKLTSSDKVETRTMFLGYMESLQETTLLYLEQYKFDVNTTRQIIQNVTIFLTNLSYFRTFWKFSNFDLALEKFLFVGYSIQKTCH